MIKSFFFKLFTFILLFFSLSVNTYADEKNILTDIIIQPLYNNTYTLNLLFKEEYNGNAFLQKGINGKYTVFIPDVVIPDKNTKIIYEDLKDKSNIALSSQVKDYVTKGKNSSYVKINVNMADDFNVKLVKDVQSNYHPVGMIIKNFLLNSYVLILALGFIIWALRKIYNKFNEVKENSNSYTSYPVSFKGFQPKKNNKISFKNKRTRVIHNFKNIFKSAQESGFNCFTLPIGKNPNFEANEIKSTIKQTSALFSGKNNKKITLKHTNPITKSYDETSELTMPMVNDSLKTNDVSNLPHISSSPKAELISILNLSVNKGFYLTTVEDTFALFGFINENIFLLEKFKDLSQINLQARFYEHNENGEIYIVRLDSYKAMVEITDSAIRELAKI